MSRKPRRVSTRTTVLVTVLILAMIAATIYMIRLSLDLVNKEVTPDTDKQNTSLSTSDRETLPGETAGEETEETQTLQGPVLASATIGVQGDLLMHKYLFRADYGSACQLSDGSYDLTSIFKYMTDYIAPLDYAVANLETTFGGPNYPYQGNPKFNCPDALADAVVEAGYDMLLTANNHSNDTNADGIRRTLEQIRSRNLVALGTQSNAEEDKYVVVDANGIKIGMVCYTYADNETEGRPILNYSCVVTETGILNYFTDENLPRFYSEMEGILSQMKEDGAEATMLYIHWGEEYALTENVVQNNIAQKMCDMGIDVIVGGHPHVVQPMELLESTVDPDHKTVCIYSLGNAVSNQRREEMRLQTGHTEDGVLFSVTFEKYVDGNVYVSAADVLPTWVDKHATANGNEYNILPLDYDRVTEWAQMFGIDAATVESAKSSYQRTMDIVGAGLSQCQTYLEQAKAQRDAQYSGSANAA